MARRSKARHCALQMLYQKDLNPDADIYSIRDAINEQLPTEALREFAWQMFVGVCEHRRELDERIVEVAENWALSRMAPTDRNALRLGAWELLYSDTPPRVVVDEAIELARLFGTEQSSQFVNGILDRLIPSDESAD